MTPEEIERTVNASRGLGYKTNKEIDRSTNLMIVAVVVIFVLIILLK